MDCIFKWAVVYFPDSVSSFCFGGLKNKGDEWTCGLTNCCKWWSDCSLNFSVSAVLLLSPVNKPPMGEEINCLEVWWHITDDFMAPDAVKAAAPSKCFTSDSFVLCIHTRRPTSSRLQRITDIQPLKQQPVNKNMMDTCSAIRAEAPQISASIPFCLQYWSGSDREETQHDSNSMCEPSGPVRHGV